MCDSLTHSVRARSINIVAERATTHLRKAEAVRVQAHSANSLDDRLKEIARKPIRLAMKVPWTLPRIRRET